jgi:hypothetical protein
MNHEVGEQLAAGKHKLISGRVAVDHQSTRNQEQIQYALVQRKWRMG